jgi:group II intron reverse transcriptase/maturase
VAYKHLYANKGASTQGVDNDTADGFSEEKIEKIIKSLTDETYQPKPARRTYITKSNGKMRPLGIPTFTDKLVQEVLRMVLEAIYEPTFMDCSHGFRPNKSCHTALKSLKGQFHGTRWFIEGDIKGCFDNIDHHKLVEIIGNKVKDARLIKLVWKFLKAGYMEDWQYNGTHSGCPQGGIISPLFSNIYLHELDTFVVNLAEKFDKPSERNCTAEYGAIKRDRYRLSERIEAAEEPERSDLINQYKELRAKQLKTPYKSQTDKKIKYIRYADDFLIGVNGSKEDCAWIKQELSDFIAGTLKMELSEEKTLVTHSNKYARFLGYDVRVRRNNDTIKRGATGHVKKRTLNNISELAIPLEDKIMRFLFDKQIIEQRENGEIRPVHRKALLRCTELEIVATYNAELRGICNYYSLAGNFYKLNYFGYLMEYSCLKTLAAKHKCSCGQIKDKYKDGHGKWGIPYTTKKGEKRCYIAKYSDSKDAKNVSDIMPNEAILHTSIKTSFESRLSAKICELCGTTDAKQYEIHHVHKVKDLKGKEPWEQVMIAKRRKTLVLCKSCHYKIHGRVLND